MNDNNADQLFWHLLSRSALNFLRKGKVSSHMRENAEDLIDEAKFYGLKSLVDLLLEQESDNALNGDVKLIEDGNDQNDYRRACKKI